MRYDDKQTNIEGLVTHTECCPRCGVPLPERTPVLYGSRCETPDDSIVSELKRQLATQTAELENLKQKTESLSWKPIETIPNSLYVDVWLAAKANKDFGVRVQACKDNGVWYGIPECYKFDFGIMPVYWMHIPDPEVKSNE